MRIAAQVMLPLAVPLTVFAADPFVGAWKMNCERSRFQGITPPSEMIRLESVENGLREFCELVQYSA